MMKVTMTGSRSSDIDVDVDEECGQQWGMAVLIDGEWHTVYVRFLPKHLREPGGSPWEAIVHHFSDPGEAPKVRPQGHTADCECPKCA